MAILSRRFSIEHQKPHFFVEQYVKVLDKGPVSSNFLKIGVVEIRKSADYRFLKLKQGKHSLAYMTDNNPLRSADFDKKYTWERVGTTTYDSEDVIILKGTSKKSTERVRFYIGMDTYGIFKIDMSALNAVYIYKKNSEGKLYLSYHNREYKIKKTINKILKTILKIQTDTIDLAYRHEAIVLNVETDKNNSKFKSFGGYNIDMGDINLPYHPEFWDTLQTPPQSSFFRRSKRELEQLYGVSLGIQFELSNTKQKKD
ncbi:hypothetical protein DUT90_13095 [Polaribacter sp. WD7]|uniref:hypothetical protein n=1 Tax=Polaribacter sp. WD7 TaxID=2269061 RepID=UPI000DF4B155|nr:hypothetical protein [Polaribacter sp. WD7]RCS26674.1 hypothetical protein DUT90_13095 [Polaribacter sp. WD7]